MGDVLDIHSLGQYEPGTLLESDKFSPSDRFFGESEIG
jgi:hypothetical protein